MSTENIYEYLQGESQSITRWEQESAGGSGLVFIRDQNGVKMLCANIELWDAATGGTQLTLDTDYTLEYFDANISGAEGVECYAGYAVINPVYQGIALYVTGDAYGGYTSRPYRPTYSEVSSDVTVATSNMDDSIIADASSGAISVTLPDGHTKNQRFSIICTGGDTVEIIGTGITDAEFTDIGITYVWDGSAWVQLGGAGGAGGSALVNIPQPKTFVEKWNDGGAGTITSKVNEWGVGKYIIDVASTVFSKDNQTLFINVESLTEDAYSPYIGSAVTVGNFKYDHASNSFTYADSIVYIKRISLWEDDQTKLPVVQIPADPGLIKDWVIFYEEAYADALDTITMPVGDGRYEILIETAAGYQYTAQLNVDNSVGINGGVWETSYTMTYTVATGVWTSGLSGARLVRFRRWEDVAGADAQMSVPVDGWETVFDDDTNTGDVANAWGAGTYELLCQSTALSENMTCRLYLSDLTVDVLCNMIANQGTAGHYINGRYDQSANAFNTQQNFTGTSSVIKIRKFNSLVNVLHSYHPDPRQVAQKDWVEVYNSPINSASNTTFKVTDGKYIVSSGPANDTITYETSISIDNTKTLCRCVHDASFNLEYTPSTGVWNTNISNVGIHFISKWQDSQASDSPRTALDDGFETVYENSASTSNSVAISSLSSWGPGVYCVEATLGSGGVVRSALISIPDITVDSAVDFYGTADLTYDASAQTISSDETAHYLIRIRKLTGKTVIAAQYNTVSLSDGENQIIKEVPTVADINVTLPASPSLGDLFEVYNGASIGTTYKVNITTDGSTLYQGLRIGAGKNLRMRYIDGWRYEDVIIDEKTGGATGTNVNTTNSTYKYIKHSGGSVKIMFYIDPSSASTVTPTLPVTLTSMYLKSGNADDSFGQVANLRFTGASGATTFELRNQNDSVLSVSAYVSFEGDWK